MGKDFLHRSLPGFSRKFRIYDNLRIYRYAMLAEAVGIPVKLRGCIDREVIRIDQGYAAMSLDIR